jgi:hypothetical protein
MITMGTMKSNAEAQESDFNDHKPLFSGTASIKPATEKNNAIPTLNSTAGAEKAPQKPAHAHAKQQPIATAS